MNAVESYNNRQSIERISTGSERLDNLLAGGIETKAITQFYGDSGTGKTQICHILCSIVSQTKSWGGLEAKSIYIDTEGNFRPERIKQIAQARSFDVNYTLESIIPFTPIDVTQQEKIIEKDIYQYLDENGKIKLIVVDSPVAHYRFEYGGRKMLSKRQQKLYRFMKNLWHLCQEYNLAVVVTNHITTIPNSTFDSDEPYKPYGGSIMGYASTYVIHLSGLRDFPGAFHAELVKSSYHKYRDIGFMIREQGISD